MTKISIKKTSGYYPNKISTDKHLLDSEIIKNFEK